jgi:hypothetical protein
MLSVGRRASRHSVAEELRIPGNGIGRSHQETGALGAHLGDQDACYR